MVTIVEVKNKKQLKEFVEFPNKLYKGNKYYCPPMASDEFNTFLPNKNPAFDFCESRQFLAYKDDKIVAVDTQEANVILKDNNFSLNSSINSFLFG